ncbi:hypothetical protein POX_g08967 [Penicillium oxalicum]|uniref:Uncharacterized protein n=1 Tax=Penicillium oxalicum (strain 114-2 / CGMCC 5302) TaxID=933388 RepID=S8ALJ4_PENO1|nr:hypothetical protein POX_g08967 [Penicillium oxalicum]EPS26733.1 hypothetical protein PDE_01671 [Penicillium oxalicum 114-2]KAI2786580.1 hypothetical protein POX_g08967 [Penicillium oxalicum]
MNYSLQTYIHPYGLSDTPLRGYFGMSVIWPVQDHKNDNISSIDMFPLLQQHAFQDPFFPFLLKRNKGKLPSAGFRAHATA